MIDDEIKEALNVDPSPEFIARVRTRIANEPQPSAWRWSWTLAAAGAMAAAVVIAVVVSRPTQPIERGPGSLGPGAIATVFPPVPSAGPEEAAPRQTKPVPSVAVHAAGPSTVRAAGSEGPARRAAPEILLDPAETRALRALIAGVRDGRVDLTPLQTAAAPKAMELEPVADIVIAPITIEPIAPVSGAEGVRP